MQLAVECNARLKVMVNLSCSYSFWLWFSHDNEVQKIACFLYVCDLGMLLTFLIGVLYSFNRENKVLYVCQGVLYFFHQRKLGALIYRGVTLFSSEKIIFATIKLVATLFHRGATLFVNQGEGSCYIFIIRGPNFDQPLTLIG